MDTSISRPTFPAYLKAFAYGILALLCGWFGYTWMLAPEVRIDRDRLEITTVKTDRFYEYINLDGQITPAATYLIDSKVAGNVERIYAESGQLLRRGDTMLSISNADLELEVMQRESQLIEQLNNQRQTRLLLNQNDFNRREQLVETNFQLDLQRQQFLRDSLLFLSGTIAASAYEPTANRYAYLQNRRRFLLAALRADSIARSTQLTQISAFETRIADNLQSVSAILDRLYVLSPTDGRLGDFTVQAGQSIANGERLGEVYSLEDPQIVVEVDEFYLDKIFPGQQGLLLGVADSIKLRVDKIYPDVSGGRFRVDVGLDTANTVTPVFVNGQSVRLRLNFGLPTSSTLLASGDFFRATGGYWVYRLTEDGAERTPVRLGRANPQYYEVLEGLRAGDRVIVSAYEDFADHTTLKLQ